MIHSKDGYSAMCIRLKKFFHSAVKFQVKSLVNIVFSIWKFFQPTTHKISSSCCYKKTAFTHFISTLLFCNSKCINSRTNSESVELYPVSVRRIILQTTNKENDPICCCTYRVFQKSGHPSFNFAITSVNVHRFWPFLLLQQEMYDA